MIISLIVVVDTDNGIGRNNQLLCHLPADLRYFKNTTTGHHIVMGRKTYESVGKPLPNRTNIVVSASVKEIDGCIVVESLASAIAFAREHHETELFITGGGIIFSESMGLADRIYLTKIHHQFDADTFFPEIDPAKWEIRSSDPHQPDDKNKFAYTFYVYERTGQASSDPASSRP